METRQSKRGRYKKKKNRYINDVMDSVVWLNEIGLSQDIDLVDDRETDWILDQS